jgi:hypothetical protein
MRFSQWEIACHIFISECWPWMSSVFELLFHIQSQSSSFTVSILIWTPEIGEPPCDFSLYRILSIAFSIAKLRCELLAISNNRQYPILERSPPNSDFQSVAKLVFINVDNGRGLKTIVKSPSNNASISSIVNSIWRLLANLCPVISQKVISPIREWQYRSLSWVQKMLQ